MSETFKITSGTQIPTLSEVKDDLQKKYPNIQTKTEWSLKGISTTTTYRANFVETGVKANKAYVKENSNGTFVMHGTGQGIKSMFGQNNKTTTMGVNDEKGQFYRIKDKNNNQKIDSGEVFYFKRENTEDVFGKETMLF